MLDWLNEQESLRGATHALVAEASRIDIAVAFWGAGPMQRLPLSARRVPLTRIIANVLSGGTNPAAVRELLREFGSDRVRQLNDLHAKVFLSDTHLIAGSANVSTNGLGLEGNEQKGWREVCLRTDDAAMMGSARTWFDTQWNASSSITEDDLVKAEDAWRRSRRARPFPRRAETEFADGLLAFPFETLEERRLFIAITSESTSVKAEQTLTRLRKNDPTVDGYEDWSSIPLDATLLAFGLDKTLKNGKFRVWWDDFWETPIDRKARRANTVDGVTLVRRARSDRALPISAHGQKAWTRDIEKLCQSFRDNPKLLPKGHSWDDWCLTMEDAWLRLKALTPSAESTETSSENPSGVHPSSAVTESVLATISDDELLLAIRRVSDGRRTFQTTDLIRHIAKRYLRDRDTPVSASPNAQFARRLSKDRKKLGIRLVASDENVRDDDNGRSMTSRWELES